MAHKNNSPHTPSIHTLDDDSLLNVFYIYRPFLLGEDERDEARHLGGKVDWVRGRWWYKLAHVCQRWRNLILGSASYLDLSLVCTKGTPIADMLAHSPPLPLVIDYFDKYRNITAEDEEGTIFALNQRDRVRRVRLRMAATILQRLFVVMDKEYPILEYLVIARQPLDMNTASLPETMQAPHLRHLTLKGSALPMGSRLLTTAVSLVTLKFEMVNPSTYLHPNTLLQWISFMPQLETLAIRVGFHLSVPNRDVEREFTHTPIMTTVTLPNLHRLKFRGVSTYLEALVHRVTAPSLKKLEIYFSNQITSPIPHLTQFMNITENLRFGRAKFSFSKNSFHLKAYPREVAPLYIMIYCSYPGQVSSMVQIFNARSQATSALEHLTLEYKVHGYPSEHNDADRTEWRKLLRSFSNVKTLRVVGWLVE
jgi:hypothetical protein